MSIWKILGWIIWVVLAVWDIVIFYMLYNFMRDIFRNFLLKKHQDGKQINVVIMTLIQAILLLAILVSFLLFNWNKLHILWLLPIAIFVPGILFMLSGKLPDIPSKND